MNILLVEDTKTNLLIISKYLREMGHRVITAGDGAAAVDAFARTRPDLVLMDVNMPKMDGFQAAREIRQSCGTEDWIPIIFLSALIEDKDIARGLDAGGDDYLSKPVSPVVLKSKIGAMQRIANMRMTIKNYADSLTQMHATQSEEIDLARHVFQRMTRVDRLEYDWMTVVNRPSSGFSGDVVAAAKSPNGDFHIMLGDATGHGLAAGLTIMPVTDVFYGLTEAGKPLATVVEKLNERLCDLLPIGRFVAAVLVAVNPASKVLEIWNGGCPPVYLIDQSGDLLSQIKSTHLPLGITTGGFNAEVQSICYEKYRNLRLYLHSDGLADAENSQGKPFGLEQVLGILCRADHRQRLQLLMKQVDAHVGGPSAQDDITIVEITANPVAN